VRYQRPKMILDGHDKSISNPIDLEQANPMGSTAISGWGSGVGIVDAF
jgi:hypothetical protein